MRDSLGDRVKKQYENRTRFSLPRRTYTIIRLDGKSFHSYTRQCQRPFDEGLTNTMDQVTKYLCSEIQGAQLGYVQSDEISILLTDFAKETTDAWFDGNVQKIASISAAMVTMKFNELTPYGRNALFDSRVFTIPDPVEVFNYMVWRQQDCSRNSISMVAQSLYSHKELQSKSSKEMQEMIWQRSGENWNDLPIRQKRGATVIYPAAEWVIDDLPVFTQDRNYLARFIPPLPTLSV